MRKADQEILSEKVLEEVLSGEVVCRVAMIDGGRPYLLPFNYGYRDGCIYIHSAPEGRKIELLRTNNRVCFEIEHSVKVIRAGKACGWSTLYRSVVGYGTVEIVSDDAGKRQGLGIIMAQHGSPGLTDFTADSLDRMVILKLTITSLTGKQSGNWGQSR